MKESAGVRSQTVDRSIESFLQSTFVLNTHTHTYTCTCTCIYTDMHVCVYIYIYVCVCIHVCIYVEMYIYIHINLNRYTRKYIFINVGCIFISLSLFMLACTCAYTMQQHYCRRSNETKPFQGRLFQHSTSRVSPGEQGFWISAGGLRVQVWRIWASVFEHQAPKLSNEPSLHALV